MKNHNSGMQNNQNASVCFKASTGSVFDDFKTDPFVTKDPFANEAAQADDPFHSHDPFAGSSMISCRAFHYAVNAL